MTEVDGMSLLDDTRHRSAEEFLLRDDKAFVEVSYLVLLDRPADESGLQSQLAALASGLINRSDLLASLSQSEEGRLAGFDLTDLADGKQAKLMSPEDLLLQKDAVFVHVAYEFVAGHAPSPDQYENTLTQLQKESSRWEILDALNPPKEMSRQGATKITWHRTAEEFLLRDDKAFVEASYLVLLDRPADESGLQSQLAALASGLINRSELLASLSQSEEGRLAGFDLTGLSEGHQAELLSPEDLLLQKDAVFVRVAYEFVAGHAPSPDQYENTLTQLQKESSRWEILDALNPPKEMSRQGATKITWHRTAEEFLLRDDKAFVEASYLVLLDRPADESGLQSQLAALASGLINRSELLASLSQSEEGRLAGFDLTGLSEGHQAELLSPEDLLLQKDAVFVRVAYEFVAGHAPSPDQYENTLTQLQQESSRWKILDALKSSEEMSRQSLTKITRHRSAEEFLLRDDKAFVEASYLVLLDRPADESGLQSQLAALASGLINRSELLASLSQSEEGRLAGFDLTGLSEGRQAELLSPEDLLLQKDAVFVRVAYEFVADHAPSPDQHENTLTQLRKGSSRWEILDALNPPKEMSRQGLTKITRRRSAEEFLLRDDETFVRASYLMLLGREPDDEGLRNHVNLLRSGVSRLKLLRGMSISDEAKIHAPNIPYLSEDQGEPHYLSAENVILYQNKSFLITLHLIMRGSLPKDEDVAYQLAQLEGKISRWEVLDGFSKSANVQNHTFELLQTARQKTTPLSASKLDSSTVFFLITSNQASTFMLRLVEAWRLQGYSARLVSWDSDARHFRLVSLTDLNLLGFSDQIELYKTVQPQNSEPLVFLDQSSCCEGDWLIGPEPFRDVGDYLSIIEVDVQVEARRIGLRAAFIFHGANLLKSITHAGRFSEAHEQYMQAILLADVVIPVSKLAGGDLESFFVQHQKADTIPLTKKVLLPAYVGDDDNIQWLDYVRGIQGILTDAADASRSLRSLYYYVNPDQVTKSTRSVFTSRLAKSLLEQGVSLTPFVWDDQTQRMNSSLSPSLEQTKGMIDGVSWASWIPPGNENAPNWLLLPEEVDSKLLEEIATFAHKHRLRISAVLQEATKPIKSDTSYSSSPEDALDLRKYTQVDKVFVASKARFDEFNKTLLSWRGKVSSAEHRFKLLQLPNELPGCPKRVRPKVSTAGTTRVLIHLDTSTDTGCIALAVDQAAKSAADRLVVTFAVRSVGVSDASMAALASDIASIQNATLDVIPDDQKLRQLLSEADFVVGSLSDEEDSPNVMDGLWCGLPCIVHRSFTNSVVAGNPGLVFVDMKNPEALAATISKMLNRDWCRYIANEAVARLAYSWDFYSKRIAFELATDRPTDGLHLSNTHEVRDVYEQFINLQRRPKLSICISTYKRAGWLELNLKNIFNQISTHSDRLEILVVDNASPDNTPEVAKPYLIHPEFRYHRNPVNVGMLGNLAVTAQKARGEYIWIIGDDDLTRPSIIQELLQILDEEDNLSLIYMNYGYTAEQDPANVTNLNSFLSNYNTLEPVSPSYRSTVNLIAAKTENFYTAIYCHVYKRDHAMRSYCQDTSGRIFSTMASCIPTTLYVLSYMADLPAYWIGEPSLVVNSNVSWIDYAPLFELEQFPRAWDLAERTGSISVEVDRRRANRLWMIAMMWENIFRNDKVGNSAYISASRVLMRLKHLKKFDKYLHRFMSAYREAYDRHHPAALLPPEELFSAFEVSERIELEERHPARVT